MNEVLYNINGKYFKDFGVFISSSKGLMDKPKPKSRKSYDWAEYHGKAVDLSKPKYDEREIELQGWIEGEDWANMKQNFDSLMAEFDKEGLARLVIEYLNNALVYDVYLSDDAELKKDFRKGRMVGFFKLKMKEPQPIKKVFKLVGNDLQLSFNSEKWVDINIDGINETQKGSVSINRTLTDRVLSGYGYSGRNLIHGGFEDGNWYQSNTGNSDNGRYGRTIEVLNLEVGKEYTFSLKDDVLIANGGLWFTFRNADDSYHSVLLKNGNYAKQFTFTAPAPKCTISFDASRYTTGQGALWFSNVKPKLEKGTQSTNWKPAPEGIHYITISGNIDEITNIETNAEELWSL